MKRRFTTVSLCLTCILFFGHFTKANAQDYVVSAVDNYVADLKNQHKVILGEIERRTDLSLTQKLGLLESETNKLKTTFKELRKKEFTDKAVSRSVTKSCTSGSSGGVTNCGWATLYAPSGDLYTTPSWISVAGTSKGITVSPDGSSAAIKMTVAGRGRNEGTLTAIFRYKPSRIVELVDSDMNYVFKKVVENQ